MSASSGPSLLRGGRLSGVDGYRVTPRSVEAFIADGVAYVRRPAWVEGCGPPFSAAFDGSTGPLTVDAHPGFC